MPFCCAKDCSNRWESGLRFFALPRDIERKKVWIEKSDCKETQYSMLCEFHFDENAFEINLVNGLRKLKPNAIPTIFLTTQNTEIGKKDAQPEMTYFQEQLSVDGDNEQSDRQQNTKSVVAGRKKKRVDRNALYLSGSRGRVFLSGETGIQAKQYLKLHRRLVRNGVMRESNEIKRLSNEIQRQFIVMKKQADEIKELRKGLNYYREKSTKLSRVSENLKTRLKTSMKQNNKCQAKRKQILEKLKKSTHRYVHIRQLVQLSEKCVTEQDNLSQKPLSNKP